MSEEKRRAKIIELDVKTWGIILVVVAMVVPVIIACLLNISVFKFALGNTESWIGFWGSYIGGLFGMIGVIITTYVIITNNKKNIEYSMELQDRQVRDRDATTFLLNKSEQVVELLDDANTLLTTSVSLFIRMALEVEAIHKIIEIIESGRTSDVDLNENLAERIAHRDVLTAESSSIRPLVIDRLNKAVAKSIFIDGISDDIRNMIEFIIQQEDVITDALAMPDNSKVIDQLGKGLIEEVSMRYTPIQKKLTNFSKAQLEKLKNE